MLCIIIILFKANACLTYMVDFLCDLLLMNTPVHYLKLLYFVFRAWYAHEWPSLYVCSTGSPSCADHSLGLFLYTNVYKSV